ncbi:hypothetical protein BHM03_00000211 [Ensete ventricosum]|nr:hypothetical protein BHM03_00000211 [Ensete ventricosum]
MYVALNNISLLSLIQAKQIVGSTFLVKEDDRPDLEEDEFYTHDLVGMRVVLKKGVNWSPLGVSDDLVFLCSCHCGSNQMLEKAAVEDEGGDYCGRGDGSGWERLLQRKGGNGCVAATRAASCGCAWPRKNSDDRQEAAGASTFGAAAAAGEMGIWWSAAAEGRKKGWATASRNDDREGQRRSRGEGNDGGWAIGGRGLETATMA